MGSFQDGSPFALRSTDVDFEKLWREARSRWLRPSEIYDVLINHFIFSISKEPLTLPPSGTLILFDRKMLRNFRRDGHQWRKKKDNKTVKEAHEHLKVGSEEKIHVYYAHGEGESNLQRRVYWLLDKALEHIVLVHYLEVKEVRASMHPRQLGIPMQGMPQELYTTYKPLPHPGFPVEETVPSSVPSSDSREGPTSDFNSNEDSDFDKFYVNDFQSTGETGFGDLEMGSEWLNDTIRPKVEQVINQDGGNLNGSDMVWKRTLQPASNPSNCFCHNEEHVGGALLLPRQDQYLEVGLPGPCDIQVYDPETSRLSTTLDYSMHTDSSSLDARQKGDGQGTLNVELSMQTQLIENGDEVFKKLDSLDRWMQRELPAENKTSSLTTSTDSSCVLGTAMHGDKTTQDRAQVAWQSTATEEMTPSFTPKLFFEITDYSPTWSFSLEDSKVIITGYFSGDVADFENIDWYCMFGDKQIHADVVQSGVLKFRIPKDAAPGVISFYIADGSMQPCSDVKQFELKENVQVQEQLANSGVDRDFEDARLQYRLSHLLLEQSDPSKRKIQKGIASMPSIPTHLKDALEQEWVHLNDLLDKRCNDLIQIKELLLQMILKCLMVDLINRKLEMDGKSGRSFDSSGQSVLHLASALGYDWVINIIKASGMSIDFRDKQGWTALHWAAYYGRERMVAALLAAGARPGAITDPTPERKLGCTPADIAAAAGHDGLAGYLSEQALASHLNSLTLEENERDRQTADDEGHRVVEYLKRSLSLRKSIRTPEDEHALEHSLSAIGNATTNSARIHAAFKEYFTRERLRAIVEEDEYGFTTEEQMAVQKIQKAYRTHRERRKKESAALQIQNHFRVWKTRRNFLNLRKNVIKIQAYFRMHRARRQYHKLVWSVGVLEKAILRWRQRRKGLRGYQPEVSINADSEDGNDFLLIGRKQAEETLDRAVLLVQSMVRSKIARQQYKRMKENFEQAKINAANAQADDQFMTERDAG